MLELILRWFYVAQQPFLYTPKQFVDFVKNMRFNGLQIHFL